MDERASGRTGHDEVPWSYRRPTSRHRVIDALLEAVYGFVGPASASYDPTPARSGRSEEEAAAGYQGWDRVTRDGRTYLVERRDDVT